MAWQENNGKSKMATTAQQPAEILLTSGNCAIPTILPRIEPNQAFKTLGVYISASGCQQKQLEVLRVTAQQYFESVHKSSLFPSEAYLSYSLYLRPKLSYPLPCTSLTLSQCRTIQAPALAALLPKLHLNRHSPRAILFSGPIYGGLSLPDLYDDQGIGQLRLLIGHLKLDDDTGQLIRSTLSHLQLQTGSNQSIYSLNYFLYEHLLEPNWLTAIWAYTTTTAITLDIENQWLPQKARVGDIMILDHALQLNFNTQQL
jgi:hypothetical protein